jgi:hypothetical protein
MKRCILTVVINLLSLALMISRALAWPAIYPSGTTYYDPAAAYPGYILYIPLGSFANASFLLINMNGKVVHSWRVPADYEQIYGQLLPDGHLLFIARAGERKFGRPGFGPFWMGGAAGRLVEMDWDGNVVFSREDLNMHHDFTKLPNGHYMYLDWEPVAKPLQAKIRGGMKGSEFPHQTMFSDVLVEIDAAQHVVWTWHAKDHLDPDIDIIGPLYRREEWCNGISFDVLDTGNILLTCRNLDSILTIDRKSGKIISRWGNASYLDKGTGRVEHRWGIDTLAGPHDGQEISYGLPGSGHLLCYDNGVNSSQSRVVEIDPVTGASVWQLPAKGDQQLGRRSFSYNMGGVQRLPNGNTLVCNGADGTISQLTPRGDLVWQYVNPYATQPEYGGAVYKARQYSRDWCPQLKQLPPPQGPAVYPGPNGEIDSGTKTRGQESAADAPPTPSSSASTLTWVLILIGGGALAFQGGRWSKRKI